MALALVLLVIEGGSSTPGRILPPTPHGPQRQQHWRLVLLEASRTARWNRSAATMVVLGKKANRDFGVYAWPFHAYPCLAFQAFTPRGLDPKIPCTHSTRAARASSVQ